MIRMQADKLLIDDIVAPLSCDGCVVKPVKLFTCYLLIITGDKIDCRYYRIFRLLVIRKETMMF
jgi:hypothetical protein